MASHDKDGLSFAISPRDVLRNDGNVATRSTNREMKILISVILLETLLSRCILNEKCYCHSKLDCS